MIVIYALLYGDFKDSNNEVEDDDNKILQCALDEIKTLNAKYHNQANDIFYFRCT